MKRLIILNPQSRNGRAGRLFDRQRGEWEGRLGAFDLYPTKAPGDATEKVKSVLRNREADQILIAGGDGSINEAFRGYWEGNELIGTDIPLGILNFGTGGDFFRTVEASSENYLDALVQNRFQRIDAARVIFPDGGEHPFLNIASVGMAGEMLHRLKQSRFQAGSAAYFYHTLRTLFEFHPRPVEVEFVSPDGDRHSMEREILNCFVCNGRFSGGGMQWAPTAQLPSGRFCVTLINGGNKGSLIRHSRKIYSGQLGAFPGAETFEATEVVVKSAAPLGLETDGEVVESENAGAMEIRFRLMAKVFPLVL